MSISALQLQQQLVHKVNKHNNSVGNFSDTNLTKNDEWPSGLPSANSSFLQLIVSKCIMGVPKKRCILQMSKATASRLSLKTVCPAE